MNTFLKASKPDEIEFSLVVTMPLKDWKLLKEKLVAVDGPALALVTQIQSMVHRAEQTFYPEPIQLRETLKHFFGEIEPKLNPDANPEGIERSS